MGNNNRDVVMDGEDKVEVLPVTHPTSVSPSYYLISIPVALWHDGLSSRVACGAFENNLEAVNRWNRPNRRQSLAGDYYLL